MEKNVSIWVTAFFALLLTVSFQNCSNSAAPDVSRKSSSSDSTNETLAKKSCNLDSGAILQHGESSDTEYYASAAVGCGQSCELAAVTCDDGNLTGPGTSPTCNVTACDAKSSSGDIVNGLIPNKKYMVTVHGITESRDGGDPLGKVSIKNCQGIEIAATGEAPINWHDGQAPQTANLVVTAPADGCISADTDFGDARHITAVETTDDAQSVTGNSVIGLQPGKDYLMSAYGYTTNRGDGDRTLLPVSFLDCADDSVVASTNQFNINWHDGQTSQEVTMPVTAPASGCVKATTDFGDAFNVTAVPIHKSAQVIAGNELTLSQPGKSYFVHVYGLTEDRGQGNNDLQPIGVTDCNGTSLASVSAVTINWHDGQTAHSAGFVITAPADGCIRGVTDIGPAEQLSAMEL